MATYADVARRRQCLGALAGQCAVHGQRAAALALQRAAGQRLARLAHQQVTACLQRQPALRGGGLTVQAQRAVGRNTAVLITAQRAGNQDVLSRLDLRTAFRVHARPLGHRDVARALQIQLSCRLRLAADKGVATRRQGHITTRSHRAVSDKIATCLRGHAVALCAAGLAQLQGIARVQRQRADVSVRRAIDAQVAPGIERQARISFRLARQKQILAGKQIHGAFRLQARIRARRHLAIGLKQQSAARQQLAIDLGVTRGPRGQRLHGRHRAGRFQRAFRAQHYRAASLHATAGGNRQVAARRQRQRAVCGIGRTGDTKRARRPHVHALIAVQGARQQGIAPCLQIDGCLGHHVTARAHIATGIQHDALALRLADLAQPQIASAFQLKPATVGQRAAIHAQMARRIDRQRPVRQCHTGQIGVTARAHRQALG
ncbi:hypothetical protein D3C85_200430 [compost metagenome]